MSENSSDSVLGSLPHSRPHRRSAKRAARAEQTAPAPPAEVGAAAARSVPPEPDTTVRPIPQEPTATSSHSLPTGTELVSTAVKAAVELTEIGLSVGARALRIAVSRLPRP